LQEARSGIPPKRRSDPGKTSGAAIVAALPSPALASGLRCGDTVTSDITLHRDLTNCPGDGVVIGADGVPVDLIGHAIDGDGAGEDDIGVANRDGHDRLAVVDGTVREFGIGVFTGGGADNRLRGVALARNVDFGAISRTRPAPR
jgi:hypothetical protein